MLSNLLLSCLQWASYIWQNRKDPKILTPFGVLLLLFSYSTGLLHTIVSWLLFALIVIFSILSGLSIVLCRGAHRVPPAPRPCEEQKRVSRFMEQLVKNYSKHYYKHRLVISEQLDKAIQEVFDLVIRDFCLSWFSTVGKDETAFVEILNKEMWTIIENLVVRFHNVDSLNFLLNDLVNLLHDHFQDLRLSDARQFPGQTIPFLLHPCLKDKESEMKHLRICAEALLYSLLPAHDSNCPALRYILREIVAGSLFLGTAESVCDPDYINQTIAYYLEDREKIVESHKQQYAYAETYEDFIKMINTTTDVDTLKQIRYHTIAEIMQATVIHNQKYTDTLDGGSEKKNKKNKRDALRDRNLKRYINQCRVAKSQCEKKIRNLGGPDYRIYGLGHGQPIQETGQKPSKTQQRNRRSTTKLLTFMEIMDNSLARSYFMLYLQRHHNENLLRFWLSTEKLRLLKSPELQLAAQEVFQEFVTPSAAKLIKMDSSLVRGMEELIYGTSGPDYFWEAQKLVYQIMEDRFYSDFVLSRDYTEFVCQSESALDQMRADLGRRDEHLAVIDWSDGYNMGARRNIEATKDAMSSNIEDRNDYAVRKLQLLDQNIAAKMKALELSRRAIPPRPEQIAEVEKEIEVLNTERRHLEFHIERTDLWCEMLGSWKAVISTAEFNQEDKSPLFVICVSCEESAERIHDPGAASSGWVVVRQLKDFQGLHAKLKDVCVWMSKELPVSSKKWFQKYDNESLDSLKSSLQEYLNIVLQDDRLAQSDEIYSFLIPSPEYLRQTRPKPEPEKEKKGPMALLSNIKGSIQNLSFPGIIPEGEDADEVDAGIEENVQDRKDSIAEPLYNLIGEVFELKGVFKYLRRTLITFVQVTFGGTINRHLREFVSWLISEPMLIYYIQNFKESMWPKGVLAPYPPKRTDLEKLRTREQAKEKVMKNVPDVLQNLVGKRNSKLGFRKVFEAFQDFRTNKHIFYILLERIIITTCPEIKSQKVLQRIKKNQGEDFVVDGKLNNAQTPVEPRSPTMEFEPIEQFFLDDLDLDDDDEDGLQ